MIGQVQASGIAMMPESVQAAPFVVPVKLDDEAFARTSPAGSAGDAAIFADAVKAAHIIRKVLVQRIAITNYVARFRLLEELPVSLLDRCECRYCRSLT